MEELMLGKDFCVVCVRGPCQRTLLKDELLRYGTKIVRIDVYENIFNRQFSYTTIVYIDK